MTTDGTDLGAIEHFVEELMFHRLVADLNRSPRPTCGDIASNLMDVILAMPMHRRVDLARLLMTRNGAAR